MEDAYSRSPEIRGNGDNNSVHKINADILLITLSYLPFDINLST